eukprot:TRINITY_DN516_c0_g1_i2.p1 TRINITY_DN516_c0_g1~~TRINITY_DN516_c0_g1_i2.p1  ORF type:complete len:378 (+),score=58.05 TRINITY_DN516_c0_g1_i2:49-1182(+)
MSSVTNPNHLGSPVCEGTISNLLAQDFRDVVPKVAESFEVAKEKELKKRDFSNKVEETVIHAKDDTSASETDSPVGTDESPKGRRSKSKSPSRHQLPEKIKISIFAEPAFSRIRKQFGITSRYLATQLASNWNEVPSPGKGGSNFYFVGDLVLKSMNDREIDFFKKFLPKYLKHVSENRNTLLSIFMGWYGISYRTPYGVHSERYLLMNNVLQSTQVIPTIYDLKGSTLNRDGGVTATVADTTVILYKDNDLDTSKGIQLDYDKYSSFNSSDSLHNQIASDSTFLQKCNIVDYSLILGVRPATSEPSVNDLGVPSVCGKEVYYLGIIDVLQEYTAFKGFETALKGLIADESEISVVAPDKFAARFCEKLKALFKENS